MTNWTDQYERRVSDLERDIEEQRFTPEAIPGIVAGIKDEIRDLAAGFRDKTGERIPMSAPLMPMADAARFLRRLNVLINGRKPKN